MRVALLTLAALVTIAVYGPALHAPFVYDDPLWLSASMAPLAWTPPPTRLLTMATYRWTGLLFGSAPFAFHVGNLALHLAIGLVAGAIARRLAGPSAGLLATVVYWWHGLNSEAVIYLVGRSDLLLALGGGLALWALLARSWWGLVPLVLVSLTKEVAIGVPLLLGWTWWLRRGAPVDRRLAWGLAGLLALSGLALARVWNGEDFGALSVGASFALLATGWWRAVGLFVWPRGLSLIPDVMAVSHTGQLLAAIGVLLLIGAVWLHRQRWPVTAWLVGGMLICLVPRVVAATQNELTERQLPLLLVLACIGVGVACCPGCGPAFVEARDDR